ncbi:hypothetical protein NQ318_004475, partial [Aromia moschata]
ILCIYGVVTNNIVFFHNLLFLIWIIILRNSIFCIVAVRDISVSHILKTTHGTHFTFLGDDYTPLTERIYSEKIVSKVCEKNFQKHWSTPWVLSNALWDICSIYFFHNLETNIRR